MYSDCTRDLLIEIENTEEAIKNFSQRVDGLPDELILFEAQKLVEDIKNMIEQKRTASSNLKF
jgi:hypothetical protein